MHTEFVSSSVYQSNVVDHMEELELELHELSEEECERVVGGSVSVSGGECEC